MRRTKSAPSVRKKKRSKSKKKLSRTRSAPKRISTSRKKRSKKKSKPRMLSIVPRPVPQLDWRVAHPDQYSRIYERSIPSQNVKLVKRKGGSKKRRKKSKRK